MNIVNIELQRSFFLFTLLLFLYNVNVSPPKSYYNKVQEWSKERKSPELTWKNYVVKLIKDASNFDEGQRRIVRYSEGSVLLSSEASDESAETAEECKSDTENESDASKTSDLEFQSFSSQKIVKRKRISVIEEDSVSSSSSDNLPSNSKNTNLSMVHHFKYKENTKHKRINEKELINKNLNKNLNTCQSTKVHKKHAENNELVEVVANACYEQVKVLLQKKIDGIKKSILYDIRKGFEELHNNLLLNLPKQDEINPVSALKQVIGIKLPTSTLEEFNSLDLSIDADEKRGALRSLLERYVEVPQTYKKAIHDSLSAIMAKNVQVQFTAFGRQKNENKKLNFSTTNIYNLLMDILISKFGAKDDKNINSYMSRWFSGAVDRCGGRKKRENADRSNINEEN